jgi:catecholate siderophore receptor
VGVDGGDGSEGITAAIQNLKPEEVKTYEIGTKWDVLNENLI